MYSTPSSTSTFIDIQLISTGVGTDNRVILYTMSKKMFWVNSILGLPNRQELERTNSIPRNFLLVKSGMPRSHTPADSIN